MHRVYVGFIVAQWGGGAKALPLSLPCVRGGAAQRWWGCEACLISRLRATPASCQPLSQPSAASSPYTGEPISTPESLPCVRGGAAQRRRGCEACLISRLRATPASCQPLSQPSAASSPYTGEPISTPESLPCVRGGAAQRRRGCEVCLISRLRATPASRQPLSQPLAASSPYTGEPISTPESLPLHRGSLLAAATKKGRVKPVLAKGITKSAVR